jgi:F-type H+-transporting ATPase subunit epsilon|tara:strand:+ start:244 stop:633 length:390 start_codon:yes stop_codon:yes gene_type:complete
MSEDFNVEIVSPEKSLLKEKSNSIILPAYEGEMTILSNHIPLITFLKPGIIKVSGNSEKKYFVEDGTVEFSNNNLTILSSTIVDLKDLSKNKISEMIENTKNQLKEENLDDKKRYIFSHKLDCLSGINQ